jgi:hypothetical protein
MNESLTARKLPCAVPVQEEEAMSFDVIVEVPRSPVGGEVGLLAYLDALTFEFEREGQRVSCVLVYAEPDPLDGRFHCVIAAESGHEGIACVDDTARAASLALTVYERTGSRRALALARKWLTFVAYMQYPDGSFANFIRNAAGIRNASGPTSYRGGHAWSMRALWALARAYRLTGDRLHLDRYHACRLTPTTDLRTHAVLALSEMEVYRRDPDPEIRASVLARCRAIAETATFGYFRAQPESPQLALWGYHQLHAVAEAVRLFDQPDLLAACRTTVTNLIEPNVENRFWHAYPSRSKDGVCAYDVAPIVQGLASLYRATNDPQYRRLALDASAWFYGRNDAHAALFDPTTGRCRDGISRGMASCNCGAESSIEAGFAELERRELLRQP